jgi:hypothetical protein
LFHLVNNHFILRAPRRSIRLKPVVNRGPFPRRLHHFTISALPVSGVSERRGSALPIDFAACGSLKYVHSITLHFFLF